MRIGVLVLLGTMMFLLGSVSAAYIQILGPVHGTLNQGGSIYLGKIGPGQSFYISASATTTDYRNQSINLGWSTMNATQLPAGWSAEASPLYADPMRMKIQVAPDTETGEYKIVLHATDVGNYSRTGNLTVTAFVNVTPNVFDVGVTPTRISTGVGQPTNLYITINNTGVSDNPFIINAYGLPVWNASDQVIALHSTSRSFVYPVYVQQPGAYTFNITVNSASSPQLERTFKIVLVANESLENDYNAVGQGVIVSPIIYEPAYAFMLLMGQLYKLVTGS